MDAPGRRVAAVVGTWVAIITVERDTRHTVAGISVRTRATIRHQRMGAYSGVTYVERARIPVVGARPDVGCVHTPGGRITTVIGADVLIIAVARDSYAPARLAGVVQGAGVSVVTGSGVVRVDAAVRGDAAVIGAWVAIVAAVGWRGRQNELTQGERSRANTNIRDDSVAVGVDRDDAAATHAGTPHCI